MGRLVSRVGWKLVFVAACAGGWGVQAQAQALSASISSTPVSCFGGSNGTATVVASGGTPGYNYSWSPLGGTGSTTLGREAGDYTVTVTDGVGAQITRSVTIGQPPNFSATLSTVQPGFGLSNGSISISGSGATPPYSYAWSPSGGNVATASNLGPGTYTVTVTDNNGCPYQRSATLTALAQPVAEGDLYTTPAGASLVQVAPGTLANDTGTALTAVLVSDAANGSLALSADGSFTYQPNPGFTGVDAFQYTANSGGASSAPVTVTLLVGHSLPTAVADSFPATADAALNVGAGAGVLANDVASIGLTLSAAKHADPANGSVTVNADGSFVYIPNAGFVGADSFQYTASDGYFGTPPATVTVNVAAAPLAPVGVPALSPWGLALLAPLLGWVARRRVRRT